MTKLVWTTVQRKVKDLLPFKQNPRKMSDKQVSDLKKSIETYNLVEIPAIDLDDRILAGHQRLAVMQLLGRGEEIIDCRIPNRKLTETEYKQYLVISNKVHGDWDEQILHEYFETDLLLDSGFDQEELTDMFTDILETENDEKFNVEEELKKIKNPKSKIGELYQLGSHRLYCGDSTKIESVRKVVGDAKIDMIYCDPVYNINLSYEKGIGGTKNYGGSAKDARTEDDYEIFLKKTIENALAVSNKNTHVFYYCDQTYVPMVAMIYKSLGVDFKRICIWLKGIANPTPQVAFSKVYEPCVYGVRGKPYLSPNHHNFDEVMNKEIGTGNQMIENFMDMIDVWAVQRLSGNSYEHPTQKPVTLHDKPIRRCTKVGDNILSLFGGSGGELLAAEQLKRKCFMVEMDPVFVDLIIKRYEAFTGDKAIKILS
ncbi:MAG: DNA modification methylase [Methanomassiliicoccales archaeon]|jgi:DNA modification methylase